MMDEETILDRGFQQQGNQLSFNGQPFEPNESNTFVVYLDGGAESDLNWTHEKSIAESAIEEGKKILWNLDLGTVIDSNNPIHNNTLVLSCQHFYETVWLPLGSDSIGVILPSSIQHSILDSFPEPVPFFLFLDLTQTPDPIDQALALHPERYERFHLIAKGANLPTPYFEFQEDHLFFKKGSESTVALCLPSADEEFANSIDLLKKSFRELKEPRLIVKTYLTTEWEGVDELYIPEVLIDPMTRRKLQGFEAAGGTVFSIASE